MTLKNDPKFEEKLTFCLKNDMNNFANFNSSSGKSENLHFNGTLIETSCVVKNDLWFQNIHRKFGEFSQYLKVILDKSSVYNVLAEGMYFLDNCSPLNFNFSDFSLLV